MERELLFEGKENATSVNIKEFSPKGAMLDITLDRKNQRQNQQASS